MSVYTIIEESELESFLSNYNVGELKDFQGITDGIENTNYFVDTSGGRYVLTIFEHHTFEEMQYYINLMHHLADHDVPSADPVADKNGDYLSMFKDKPIALVERLDGSSIDGTTIDHCAQLGTAMGKMHAAGLSYPARQTNPRGPEWYQQTTINVMEKLRDDERSLLIEEVEFQKTMYNNFGRDAELPCGVIHADLFRDNALWSHDSEGDHFSGIIDFYYSCDDVLLYDLAVAANDWCTNDDLSLNRDKVMALLTRYHAFRPLSSHEQEYWPAMLRAGALRFWLSRLQDKYFPRPGELVHTKDPDEFKVILLDRIDNDASYLHYWI